MHPAEAAPRKGHVALLSAAAVVLFGANIWGYGLWAPDEPRYGLIAREMLQTGDPIVLRVNEQPYFEKPPLLFWSIAALSAPMGDVTEWSARLPSVAAGAVTVVFTYLLACRLFGPTTALWAGIVLLTINRVWWQARTGQTDMMLTAFLTMNLYAFWRWHETRTRQWDGESGGAGGAAWLFAFFAAMAAAVYTKGPPGFLFPIAMVVAFYWGQPQRRKETHWVIGASAVLVLIGLWYLPSTLLAAAETVHRTEGDPGANLFRQTIGRAFLGVSKAQWPWYYFETVPVDLLPWSLFLPWTAWWVWRRRRDGEGMRLLLSWTVPAFIVFSIIIGKRAIYLLPLFPVFAIWIAASVLDLADWPRAAWRRIPAGVWAAVLLVMASAPVVLLFTEYAEAWHWGLAAFGAVALGCGLHAGWLALRTPARAIHKALAGHFAGLSLLTAVFVLPAIDPYKSAEDFTAPLRALSVAEEPYRLYSVAFTREGYIYYARRPHEEVLTDTLDVAAAVDMDYRSSVEKQVAIRRRIARAVEETPVANIAAVTAEELEALDAALRAAVREQEVDRVFAEELEEALEEKVRAFAAEFEEPEPAFLFVRHEDWRWMLPFNPEMRAYHVVHEGGVGHRDVLLLANDAGWDLLQRRERARPVEALRPDE